MTSFACETRDPSGRVVQKTIDASSKREAMTLLEEDGLFPIAIREAGSKQPKAAALPKRASVEAGRHVGRRIKGKELLNFSLQLGSSVTAGVPLLAALGSIGRQTPNLAFQAVLQQMTADLEGGLSLSEAMRNHPRTFPDSYTSTVAAGEVSGSLDKVLDNLAEFVESEIEVRADVRSALLYPVMVVTTLGLAITVLILFVIPRFASFYANFGAELPLPTRILITVSTTTVKYFPLVLVGAVALAFGMVKLHRTPKGRRSFDRFLLRLPVIRSVIGTANTLQVTQMIGLFTEAGVPILEGLRTIARTTTNTKVSESLLAVADDVATGESLANSLEAHDCLPPTARQMLAAGESTGSLESACQSVTRLFKKELRYLTKNLAILIEPMLTLALAVIVLFVALAVFLPMWDIVKIVQH